MLLRQFTRVLTLNCSPQPINNIQYYYGMSLLHMKLVNNSYLKSNTTQIRTLKRKVAIKLRCKDCRYETIKEKLHVICDTHGRHNQQQFYRKTDVIPKEDPWRWPDPFEVNYGSVETEWNRYEEAFK